MTTLRKITIFLWWGIKQVNGWDLTLTLGRCVQQTYKKNLHPPDLTPSVLTDPLVPTGGVWVDGYWLSGTIGIAWRAHPVILILRFFTKTLFVQVFCTFSTLVAQLNVLFFSPTEHDCRKIHIFLQNIKGATILSEKKS